MARPFVMLMIISCPLFFSEKNSSVLYELEKKKKKKTRKGKEYAMNWR